MLYGLALARKGSLGNGASDEEDKFLGSATLEVSEMANIGCVGQQQRITSPRRRRRRRRSRRVRLQHQQGCDLHRLLPKDEIRPQRQHLSFSCQTERERGEMKEANLINGVQLCSFRSFFLSREEGRNRIWKKVRLGPETVGLFFCVS